MSGSSSPAAATATPGAPVMLDQQSTRDNFIPLFDGTPSGYQEWRKRITIYSKKMELMKRSGEAVLNLLGSLQGTAWKLVEDYDLEKADKPGAFAEILLKLDKAFKYDSKVEMPADFAAYFEHLGRKSNQTLLQFITDHDDKLRKVEKHGVSLPKEVQGYQLLSKANITKEQKQLIMTHAKSLERDKIQEALFTILGQDHRGSVGLSPGRWSARPSGKGRAYYTDEISEDTSWEPDYDPIDEESVYYQADDDEDWEEWIEDEFDGNAAYYQDNPEDENVSNALEFDVGEYDECYASYIDARKRFNDLRMARGFLPVVALDTNSQSSGQLPLVAKGKGKKGKGKSKGKGKGKNHYRTSRPPPKQADPRGRAQAAMNPPCLRCGSTSHKTNQCNQGNGPRPAPTASGKRQAVEGVAGDTMTLESGLVIFEDSSGAERPDCAMMDPGASSFLMGHGPFMRYVSHLRTLGYPVEQIVLKKANRTFFFGGDHKALSRWTVHLPIFINHQYGHIQAFLLKGETPMLLGRPIAKALGMTVDFNKDMIRFGDDEWRPATMGRHAEYLIPLTEDFELEAIPKGPVYDLILEDEDGPDVSMAEFKAAENVYLADETYEPEGTNILKNKTLKTLDKTILTQLNAKEAYISQTLRSMEQQRPRLLWEVYTGESRMAQLAETLGIHVQSFGPSEGWNFSLKSHQNAFLDLMDEEQPDEIFLSPTCGPWSRMQNISATNERRQEQLRQLREWHHRVHLRFVAKVYNKQLTEGRYSHIEQPTFALSWQTAALKKLPGMKARFHQCQYGCVCKDTDDIWKPVKKDTTIQTSKQAVAQVMNRLCDGSHEHCRLEGSMPGFHTHRTSFMENYQPGLASSLATAMATPEKPHSWDHGFAVQEIQQYVGKIIDLHVEGKAEALRVVQKLHRNLGHPSPQSLVDLLSSRDASQTVLQVAGSYVCAACQRYKKPNQPAPSAMPTVEHFNQQVQADVFWIKPDDHPKMPVLSIVDAATKYQSATLIPNEQSQALITAFERSWLAHFGPPECLVTDEGRGWLSEPMSEWTDSHSIRHQIAPGEAHERLALVERRHAVLRKSIEIYMQDRQLTGSEGVRQALAYVVPQLNSQPTVSGYSPAQWLLGYQPSLSGLLTSDQITPVHLGGNTTFEEALLRRNAAKTAILSADTDRRLRRALLRRYAGDNIRLAVGQTVYYWRDAQSPDLCKIRWKGPAKVLMVEENEHGHPSVYWICHKSQLIRCAPHHCRPDFHHISKNIVNNLVEAKEFLNSLKSRGVTRFLDLNKVNRQHIDDVDDDEQMFSEDDDVEGSSKRRRLDLDLNPAPPSVVPSVVYSPSVADTADLEGHQPALPQPDSPTGLMEQEPQQEEPNLDNVDISDLLFGDEPLAEPTRPSTPAVDTPPTASGLTGNPQNFMQQRRQHEQQETQVLFGPQRNQSRPYGATPYDKPEDEPADANMAFQVEDVDDAAIPQDWRINRETGYFELKSGSRPKDFWTIQAGCLIRHHMHKRTTLFDPKGHFDIPVPLSRLDPVRVTVFHTKDN